jgi:hypothetical protein
LTPLSQIEVEPLSEQRWSKVERSLLSRVALEASSVPERSLGSQRRAGRVWMLAAAVVGALLVAVLTVRAFPERALIQQPSRITTGLSGSHLALPGWSLDVEPQSAVVVGAETPHGVLVVLDRGSIVCDVSERPKEAPLVVQAGAARVRVLGTRFSVTRMGEFARVGVQQGVVEVSAGGKSWKVRAGESWPAEVPQLAPSQPVVDSSAVPSSVPEPAPSSTERRVPSPMRARVAPVAVAAPEPTPSVPRATVPVPQIVFEQATAMERTDPVRASELYRTLEGGADSWAQNALYARGRLEASRGNHAEARRLLGRYLERFPRGSNAEDARAVLKRLR